MCLRGRNCLASVRFARVVIVTYIDYVAVHAHPPRLFIHQSMCINPYACQDSAAPRCVRQMDGTSNCCQTDPQRHHPQTNEKEDEEVEEEEEEEEGKEEEEDLQWIFLFDDDFAAYLLYFRMVFAFLLFVSLLLYCFYAVYFRLLFPSSGRRRLSGGV